MCSYTSNCTKDILKKDNQNVAATVAKEVQTEMSGPYLQLQNERSKRRKLNQYAEE